MRTLECATCSETTAMSDSFRITEKDHCRSCAEKKVESEKLTAADIRHNSDPTVCIECKTDAGNRELPLLSGLPVCEACTERLIYRPFPMWVQGFMGSLALITLLGFVVNFSYIHAFIKLKQANLALGRGETELAYQHVQGAIVLVPNSKDLELIAPMYQGIMLMSKGDSQGALEPFRRFAKNFPQDEGARRFLLEAQAGAYFDQHNYPGFFQASQELARLYPEDPFMLMQESSAAACMYVVTSMEVYKKLSLLFLAEAHKRLRADDENARVYEARINHRLNTREIISSREFEERFGHGEAK